MESELDPRKVDGAGSGGGKLGTKARAGKPVNIMDLDYRERWTDASHLTALGNGWGAMDNRSWGDWEHGQHPMAGEMREEVSLHLENEKPQIPPQSQ